VAPISGQQRLGTNLSILENDCNEVYPTEFRYGSHRDNGTMMAHQTELRHGSQTSSTGQDEMHSAELRHESQVICQTLQAKEEKHVYPTEFRYRSHPDNGTMMVHQTELRRGSQTSSTGQDEKHSTELRHESQVICHIPTSYVNSCKQR
jgi:hypothetical protein